jgi:hypothetical protein
MVRLLMFFLLLANGGSLSAEMRAVPKGLRLTIGSLDHSGRIGAKISNESNKSIRIWKDSNSWGAARWRVLVLSKGQLQVFFSESQ